MRFCQRRSADGLGDGERQVVPDWTRERRVVARAVGLAGIEKDGLGDGGDDARGRQAELDASKGDFDGGELAVAGRAATVVEQ